MSISDFFENTLGANLTNSRWSWGAYNPETDQLFLRVWEDHRQVVGASERVLILGEDWGGRSAGLPERKQHVEVLRGGTEGYGVICTARSIDEPGPRKIATFDDTSLLRLGELIDDGRDVYAEITGRIPVIDLARQRTAHSTLVPDIRAILNARIDATTKESLVNARVGQGAFRTQVLRLWGSRCCVTGSRLLDAVRASHIKPWKDSSDHERLDADNGLPLIATLDALFDAGLITFSAGGTLLTSKRIEASEVDRLGLAGRTLIRQPNGRTSKYFEYHRKHVFIDEKAT